MAAGENYRNVLSYTRTCTTPNVVKYYASKIAIPVLTIGASLKRNDRMIICPSIQSA